MESTDLQIFKVIVEILCGTAGNVDASQVSKGSLPSSQVGVNSLTRVSRSCMHARSRICTYIYVHVDRTGSVAEHVTRSRRFRSENFDPSFHRRRVNWRGVHSGTICTTTPHFEDAFSGVALRISRDDFDIALSSLRRTNGRIYTSSRERVCSCSRDPPDVPVILANGEINAVSWMLHLSR